MEKSTLLTSYILPNQFIYTAKGVVKSSSLNKGDILKSYNNSLIKIDQIKKETLKGFIIKFKNGEEIFVHSEDLIQTIDGIKKVKDLNSKDLILNKIITPITHHERPEIKFLDQLNSSSTPIKTPTNMSSELALWLGIMASRGRVNSTNGTIGIEEKQGKEEKELGELFSLLTKFLFNVTPDTVTQSGRLFHQVYSKNLTRFIKQMIGLKTYLKKVPSVLLHAGLDEQLSFIRGLSFKGYKEKNYFIIFSGSSIALADFVFLILKSHGYIVSRKSSKSGSGKMIHYVKLLGSLKDKINYWPEYLELKQNMLVRIPEKIYNIRVPMKNPSYESYRSLKKYKKSYCSAYILDNINLSYPENEYYLKIKSITSTEKRIVSIKAKKKIPYSGFIIE